MTTARPRRFDPERLIEGLTLHRALDLAPGDPEVVRTAVARVTGAG